MNVILASVVLGIILIWLLFIIFAKPGFAGGIARKFVIATTAVYLSGGLLVLILAFAMRSLPFIFMVISEISILSVYLISLFGVLRLAKQVKDLQSARDEIEG